FLGSHRLKGTTLRDGEAWAIINDRIVRVGEHIDGFELQRVERYRAFLAKDDLSVVLSLPLPY
ncbi:MAG: hypothetical protein HY718_14880, partial [Planctomycetes bacterium]|nr:hypothetical protein [Planctomycetota bacterium]